MCFAVPASVEQAENEVVTEGGSVKLNCSVTAGIPYPTLLWTNVMTGEHFKVNPLDIINITRAQAGKYRCTANNTCGVDSTVVDIDVQCKNITRSLTWKVVKDRFQKKGQSADQSTKFVDIVSNALQYSERKPH